MMTKEKLFPGGMGETQTMAVLKDAQDMYAKKRSGEYIRAMGQKVKQYNVEGRAKLGKEEKYALGNGGKDETQMQQPL